MKKLYWLTYSVATFSLTVLIFNSSSPALAQEIPKGETSDTSSISNNSRELYRLCEVAQAGNGNTLYYSNGRVMTHYAGKQGATWYHSNGQVMTNDGNLISEEKLLYPCSYIE